MGIKRCSSPIEDFDQPLPKRSKSIKDASLEPFLSAVEGHETLANELLRESQRHQPASERSETSSTTCSSTGSQSTKSSNEDDDGDEDFVSNENYTPTWDLSDTAYHTINEVLLFPAYALRQIYNDFATTGCFDVELGCEVPRFIWDHAFSPLVYDRLRDVEIPRLLPNVGDKSLSVLDLALGRARRPAMRDPLFVRVGKSEEDWEMDVTAEERDEGRVYIRCEKRL